MASFTLSRTQSGLGLMSIYNAENLSVGNVGQLNGNLTTTLTETGDGTGSTVHTLIQSNSNSAAQLKMAGNNNNTLFSGYNIYASFDAECAYGYNVELDTINSVFDFSNSQSGAYVSTTESSANNLVQLGGGKNALHQETIKENLTASGDKETRAFNNLVTDSGYSNSFFSSYDSQTKFETTYSSYGAYIEGGNTGDVFNLGGKYGVIKGGNGYNIFTTAEAKNIDETSGFNVVFGGLGTNAYNDYGISNMYQGAYALYQGTAYEGANGYDTIRMNGFYGIARTDASKLAEGYDPSVYFTGSYNTFFTGESAEVDGVTINYRDLLNGSYAGYQKESDPIWTLSDFYGSNFSPTGYARAYGSQLLAKILDE